MGAIEEPLMVKHCFKVYMPLNEQAGKTIPKSCLVPSLGRLLSEHRVT